MPSSKRLLENRDSIKNYGSSNGANDRIFNEHLRLYSFLQAAKSRRDEYENRNIRIRENRSRLTGKREIECKPGFDQNHFNKLNSRVKYYQKALDAYSKNRFKNRSLT